MKSSQKTPWPNSEKILLDADMSLLSRQKGKVQRAAPAAGTRIYKGQAVQISEPKKEEN